MKWFLVVLGWVVIIGLFMASCSGVSDMSGRPVGEGSFQGEYPLTRSGILHCKNSAVWIETNDGQTWAVNGTAKASHQPIEPIWKPHPSIDGMRVSIGEMITEGLKLCD